MKKIVFIVSLFLVVFNLSWAQPPKREFRAAWIATVTNLDWPYSFTTDGQKQELINLLDKLESAGFNAIIFQIRPECDAFYNSELEPWSYYLTGSQGLAPNPYYDPLEFAVNEAHRRGLELHAWFNPYRAERSVGAYGTSPNHVTKLHPDWIIQIGTIKFLNPGLPMVRSHVTSVIMDVVNRYDLDGVHFDDYFYPYPPNNITNQDQITFNNYNRGFTDIGAWRRDNVNLLVHAIWDSIQVLKPYVKFGISPFGIWKNGVPSGITGLDAYNTIYCDAVAWLNNRIIDYLTPQLYWPFGGGQDYGKLLPWWAQQTNGRHLYPGQAADRIASWAAPAVPNPAAEVPNQIKLNRQTANVYGSVFFRANDGITNNPRGFLDSLKNNYFKYRSLVPSMDWKDIEEPNRPNDLRYEPLAAGMPYALQWELPDLAADGDSASRYVIYRFGQTPQPQDIEDASAIIDIIGTHYYLPGLPPAQMSPYYVVTALDRNFNESVISDVVHLSVPAQPVLASPENGAINQSDTLIVTWNHANEYSQYELQVADNESFTDPVINQNQVVDSFAVVTGLNGQESYFWRVRAQSAGGQGDFSTIYHFTTGFPVAPVLSLPAPGSVNISLDTVLVWKQTTQTEAYRVQLSTALTFNPIFIVLDTVVISDTTLAINDLSSYTRYYWHVRSQNQYGSSSWSEPFAFRTVDVSYIVADLSIPDKFELYQNFPNPFNPTTTIMYALAKPGRVRLIVYDVVGREVAQLVNSSQNTGIYEVQFDGSSLASGIYIYRLITDEYVLSRKMILVK